MTKKIKSIFYTICAVILPIICCGCADKFIVGDRNLRRFPDYPFETVSLGAYAKAWYVPCSNAIGTAILLPGYKANRGYLIEFVDLWYSQQFNVLLLDYRGYGDASGNPDFQGMVDDVHLAITYARAKAPIVVLHGFSLGTMVAAKVATETQLNGCIFDGLASTNGLGLTGLFLPSGMRTRTTVPKILIPKLFIHSIDDNVTVYKEAHYIYTIAKSPKSMYTTTGPHVLSYKFHPNEYGMVIRTWLKEVVNEYK